VLSEEDFKKLSTVKKAEYLKLLRASKGRDDLLYLSREILGYGEMDVEVHGKLVEVLTDGKKRKLILLPRGSFKSSLGTISYSIYRFLKNPNIRILIDSEVLENAQKFLNQVKKHLREPNFTVLYGDLLSKDHRETAR